MYLDMNLEKINFKMTKEAFNEVINRLSDEEKPNSKPVKIGLLIRSTTTNLVANFEDTIVYKTPIKEVPNMQGYFRIIHVIKDLVMGKLNIGEDILMKTILMPIGVFEDNNEYVIYFNLILPDYLVELLDTDVEFTQITDDLFKGLDESSKLIKPTVSIVK